MEQQASWAHRLSRVIANEIRRRRLELGLSTQQLADECKKLGYPLARAVLSHLENGRRENVNIAELLVIARALDIEPIFLLFPLGYEDTVEVLPGQTVPTIEAVQWVAGDEGRRWFPEEADLSTATIFQLRQLELFVAEQIKQAGDLGLHKEGTAEALYEQYAEAIRRVEYDQLELSQRKADVDRLSQATQGTSAPELLAARSRLAEAEAALEQHRAEATEAGVRQVAAHEWRRTGGLQSLGSLLERVNAELIRRGWEPVIPFEALFERVSAEEEKE